MDRDRLIDALLVLPAIAVVAVETLVLRPAMVVVSRVHRIGPMQRLHQRLARLPPGVALPLFLVPEAASRGGWLASVWLLMIGAWWEAVTVYVLTKVVAGLSALWIYQACEPALLRVRWFARMHARSLRMHRYFTASSPRFTAMRDRVRLSALR